MNRCFARGISSGGCGVERRLKIEDWNEASRLSTGNARQALQGLGA